MCPVLRMEARMTVSTLIAGVFFFSRSLFVQSVDRSWSFLRRLTLVRAALSTWQRPCVCSWLLGSLHSHSCVPFARLFDERRPPGPEPIVGLPLRFALFRPTAKHVFFFFRQAPQNRALTEARVIRIGTIGTLDCANLAVCSIGALNIHCATLQPLFWCANPHTRMSESRFGSSEVVLGNWTGDE